jgi:hypothetical protein
VCHFCQENFTKLTKLKSHLKTEHKAPKAERKKKAKKPKSTSEFFEDEDGAVNELERIFETEEEQQRIGDIWK